MYKTGKLPKSTRGNTSRYSSEIISKIVTNGQLAFMREHFASENHLTVVNTKSSDSFLLLMLQEPFLPHFFHVWLLSVEFYWWFTL